MSSSLYLVHWPLLGAVEAGLRFGAHPPALLTIAAGILCMLPFGWSFHILSERPFMHRRVKQKLFLARQTIDAAQNPV